MVDADNEETTSKVYGCIERCGNHFHGVVMSDKNRRIATSPPYKTRAAAADALRAALQQIVDEHGGRVVRLDEN